MKKITLPLLLCISCICSFGQVKLHNENEGMLYQVYDSLMIYKSPIEYADYYWAIDSTDSLPTIVYVNNYFQQDTIPVIMEVSDTSYFFGRKKGNTLETLYSWVDDSSKKYHDNNIYWVKGYEVSQLDNNYYTETDIYLDENKKLLSKNIIIWQVKRVQPVEYQFK